MIATAAGIPALLYLLYVSHYSVNVPIADDWNVIPLADNAIHHHVTLSKLWGQYGDTRLFVGYVFFAAFALFDHLNEKSIILFSAVTLIASYVLVLLMFRSYLRRRLTFLPVFSLGIVWFSIADVQNSLWSFQLAWYFVVFFFVATAYCLGVTHHYRNLFFALGVVAAILASFAEVQGFVVWPVGLVCLLWARPWGRRTFYQSAIWTLSAVATTGFYLRGFNFGVGSAICVIEGGKKGSCSLTFGLLHPVQLGRFFLVLVGNVIPTLQSQYVVVHEFLGAGIFITACFVIAQSIRERRIQTDPLPVLLILFGLMFDLMLALSRMGEGVQAAGLNRYTMPNVIVLGGIVVFVCAHVPNLHRRSEPIDRREKLKILGFAAVAALLVVQSIVATQFGITNGRIMRSESVSVARVVVNLDRIPASKRACYFQSVVVGPTLSYLNFALEIAMHNHLSLFRHHGEQVYLAQGPPRIATCDQR